MRVIRRMTESVKCVRRLLSSGMEAMIHEAGIRVELLMELRPEGRGNEDEEPAYRTAVGSGVAAYSGAEEYGSGNLGLLRRLCGDAPCLPVGRIRFGGMIMVWAVALVGRFRSGLQRSRLRKEIEQKD